MNNWILYLSLILGAALLLAAAVIIMKKRCRDTGLLCVRETWMTAVLGAMIIGLGFAFPIMKLMDGTLAGTDSQSFWIVGGFGLLCHLMGDFALLFTCVKCAAVYDDRVAAYSPFGAQTVIYWQDVVQVEKPMMKSVYVMTDRNGCSIRVGGSSKAVREFVEFAKTKVKNATGAALLHQIEHRLGGN